MRENPSATFKPAEMPHVLDVALLTQPVGWHLPKHHHPDVHELILIVNGRLRAMVDGRPLDAGPRTTVVYASGRVHEEWNALNAPLQMLYIGWARESGPSITGAVDAVDSGGRIEFAMRWAVDIVGARARDAVPASDWHVTSSLLIAALHERERPAVTAIDATVRKVAAYVDEHLTEPLGLDDLASVACLSRPHFTRVFRRATGLSPMAFVRARRVDRARRLLVTTDLPLTAVAKQAGLGDQFQLSRVFKRVTGFPPSTVRSTPGGGV